MCGIYGSVMYFLAAPSKDPQTSGTNSWKPVTPPGQVRSLGITSTQHVRTQDLVLIARVPLTELHYTGKLSFLLSSFFAQKGIIKMNRLL